MTKGKKFTVKKGPADPFRGSWYTDEKVFTEEKTAVAYAAQLTLENKTSLQHTWDEFGYEWSVFDNDKKIWEGFKFIQELLRKKEFSPDTKDGFLN